MNVLFDVSVEIVVLIALGFLLRKINIVDEKIQKGLSNILLYAALPMSIVASSTYERTEALTTALVVTAVAAFIYYIIALTVMTRISRLLNIEEKKRRVFVTMSIFANTAFLGFPLMSALYGHKGLLLAVAYNLVFNIFVYSAGIRILSGEKGNIKKIIINPVSIASIIAITLFVLPITIPSLIITPIERIGSMTVPLSMIIVGSALAPIPLRNIFSDKYAYWVSTIRLLIFPILMFAAMWFLPFENETKSIIVMMTAMPCASLNVIFAEKYDCAPDFASRTVVQSMVLMSITLPLMLLICHWACSF